MEIRIPQAEIAFSNMQAASLRRTKTTIKELRWFRARLEEECGLLFNAMRVSCHVYLLMESDD